MTSEISGEIRQEVVSVIELIRRQVVWKLGKDQRHLDKRKSMGHMPETSTLEDYNQLIQSVVAATDSRVYLYVFGQDHYYGIVGDALNAVWLILISPQGIMETAFPPDDLQGYLNKRGFKYLAKVGGFV